MLKNVFDITSQQAPKIKDRNIVLIDDVMTSGAMLSAAAKTLIKEGLSYISVLVLERVTQNA
jgi:predicted amidophosphoribosyltransferase